MVQRYSAGGRPLLHGQATGTNMSDESAPQQWTPEQKASFARWKQSSFQAAERYRESARESALARWRNFCVAASDAERAILREDVGWALAERDHQDPKHMYECGDVASHAWSLADQIAFD